MMKEPKDRQPGMTPPADTVRYKNHRFPGKIISHGVWLSYRFTLSYRDVQELYSNAVSPCPTKRSVNGAGSLGRTTPIGCVTVALSPEINGIRNKRF